MKIVHYIPSIDRSWGGTSTFMQVLAKPLGKRAELHIVTHVSENPLVMENCEVHYIPRYRPFSASWERAVREVLDGCNPDVVHINCCFSENPLVMENCEVHYIPRYRPFSASWERAVREVLDGCNPDVVHINCCWTPDCAMVQKLAQRYGYKVVLSPHGMLEPWIIHRHYYTRKLPALWLYQKEAVRKADCLHATAESERDNLLKLGYNAHVEVVGLGIDAESIVLKKSWKRTKQVLFLSRVHVKKGIHYLVEAVGVLREQLQGYKILVAGEGEPAYVDSLRQMIADRGLQDMIQLIGGVYGDEKWELFRSADFFVLPTHSENFGLAIAEALASGTPVITTVGTPWSDLNSSQAGEWIEIGTQPLVEALKRFLALPEEELERMGRNGRKLIETKYSAEVMAEKMMDVYRK